MYVAVFWEGLEDDDPINPRLDNVIANIESTCKAIIAGQGTLHGFLNCIGSDPIIQKLSD